MAVNNSMACGREGVGTGRREGDQPQCWVLPARPPGRGPGPEDLRGGAGSQKREWKVTFPRRPKTQGTKIYGGRKEAPGTEEGEGGRWSLLGVERESSAC